MKRRAVVVLIAAGVVRLIVAAFTPLFPDETYYWDWSRHLATGYFDHPPLVAWLIRAGTESFGDTSLGVRSGAVMAGVVGTLFVAATARRLAGDRAALLAAIIFALMPLSAAGLVLATPDAGLLACVAAVVYCAERALEAPAGSRASLGWWCLAGVAQGFGFWAKYTAVLVPIGLAVALALRREWRARLREPGPYMAIVVASAVFAPVLVWNARHDWVSFTYQLEHGLTGRGGSILQHELELVAGQLALVSPILFTMMLLAIAHRVVTKPPSPPSVFALLSLSATFILAFFVYSTTKRRPEPNWLAIAYVPATLVLVGQARSRRWDRWLTAGIVLAGASTLATYVNAFVPVLAIPASRDPIARAVGWDELARHVQGSALRYPPSAIRYFIAGNRYQEASELAFHLIGHPQTLSLNIGGRLNQYELWPSFCDRATPGDALVFVDNDLGDRANPAVVALTPHFAEVDSGRSVALKRRGDVVKNLRFWTFTGWRGTWPAPTVRSQP